MLMPFRFTLGKYGMPRTKFSFDYLDQLEFTRYALRNYNFAFGYEWKETRSKSHYVAPIKVGVLRRSEEHTSELQSLMRISYAVFCLKKKTTHRSIPTLTISHRKQCS